MATKSAQKKPQPSPLLDLSDGKLDNALTAHLDFFNSAAVSVLTTTTMGSTNASSAMGVSSSADSNGEATTTAQQQMFRISLQQSAEASDDQDIFMSAENELEGEESKVRGDQAPNVQEENQPAQTFTLAHEIALDI